MSLHQHGGLATAFTAPYPISIHYTRYRYGPARRPRSPARPELPAPAQPPHSRSLLPLSTGPRRSSLTMCAPPGTPQRRSRPIPEYLSVERDNPLMTRVGQREELKRAIRNRKKGNWKFASAILHATQEYLNRTTPYLTESIYVRSEELLSDSPDLTPREVYDDLLAKIDNSSAIASAATFNGMLCAMQKRVVGKYHNCDDTIEVVLRILDVMKYRKTFPNDYSFSVVFGICTATGVQKYLRVFEQYATDIYSRLRRQSFDSSAPQHPRFGGTISCSSLICARVKLGLLQEADALFDEMMEHNVQASERAFACLVGAFNRNRRHGRVVALWNIATEQKLITGYHVFSAVIASCCRTGDSETANDAIEWMLNKSQAKMKKHYSSESVVESTQASSPPAPSSILGPDCFIIVFSLAVRVGDIKLAERILFEWAIDDPEFKTTTSHAARVIASLARNATNNGIDQTKTDYMVKRLWGIVDKFHLMLCIDQDVSILNALADALVRLGRPNEACDVIHKLMPKRKVRPNAGSFKSLIRAHAKLKDMKAVVHTVKLMRQAGISLDRATYNNILHAANSCGDHEVARIALQAMRKMDTQREGESERRFQVVESASDGKEADTDIPVLMKFRQERNVQGVLQFHARAVQRSVPLGDKASGLVLCTLLENRFEKEAISVFAWFVVHGCAGVCAYNVLIHQLGKKKPRIYAPSSPAPTPPIIGFNDGYDIAERLFAAIKRRGVVAADEVTYTSLVRTCCTHGRLDRAFRLLAEMQDIGIGMSDTYAWTAVIDGCGRAGQWERGVDLLRLMQSRSRNVVFPRPDIACYNAALYAAGIHGRSWSAALEIFDVLVSQRKIDVKQPLPDLVTFSAMASIILKCRFDIPDSDIHVIQTVIDRLKQYVKTPLSEKPSQKKITSKIKRLEWIARIKYARLASRSGEDSEGGHDEQEGSEGDETSAS